MSEVELKTISNRLRAQYPIGPLDENGVPELGWRDMSGSYNGPIPSPLMLEAAEIIDQLRQQLKTKEAEFLRANLQLITLKPKLESCEAALADKQEPLTWPDLWQDKLELAHMKGQSFAGIDPSFSAAQECAIKMISVLAPAQAAAKQEPEPKNRHLVLCEHCFDDWSDEPEKMGQVKTNDCGEGCCYIFNDCKHCNGLGYKVVSPAQAAAIPEGWQLVPIEPTPEMMLHNSGCKDHASDDLSCKARQVRVNVWRHMLSAAPKPEGE